MKSVAIEIPQDRVAEFCRRCEVRELALFGSALGDFGPHSDVDLLVEFHPNAPVGFLTLAKMQRELSAMMHLRVDLVPKQGLKQRIRQAVLEKARVIYAGDLHERLPRRVERREPFVLGGSEKVMIGTNERRALAQPRAQRQAARQLHSVVRS